MNIGEIMKGKTGFTLLELLVVVLIIGILAGIALPQYQLVKDKAEFAKYQAMVGSLRDAYDDYVLIHGKGTKHFDDLAVSLPPNFEEYNTPSFASYADCMANDDMWCCIRDYKYESESNYWSAGIYCGKKDAEDSLVYYQYLCKSQGDVWHSKYCYAYYTNKRANRLCNAIGTNKKATSFHTPLGTNRGYYQYIIKK